MNGRASQVAEVPSRDELCRRVKAHLETLAQTVDSTARDAGFTEALQNMARFWRYSPMNQAYVVLQRPDATRSMGRIQRAVKAILEAGLKTPAGRGQDPSPRTARRPSTA